jgi:hypothetical protein
MSIEQLHEKRTTADERERKAELHAKWTAARQRSKQRLVVQLSNDDLARQKKVRSERNARYRARNQQRSSPKP